MNDEHIFWALVVVACAFIAYGFVALGPDAGRVALFLVAEFNGG